MTQSIFFDVIARDKASSTFSRIGRASGQTHSRLGMLSRSALGAAAGFTSVTLAAGAFLKVGSDYVGSLNKIQALTDVNDQRMQSAAKTLESSTSAYARMGQTVGDAAGGVVELTKSGLSLDKSLKAVNATMVLAKAGELDVADASSLVANTLNTFSMKASQAGDIANYLANAANISSADVTDLAESLKYVAPVAASTGVSLKQTNAILAMLSNSGIAASNAGTGFRKFLLSLQAPSGAAAQHMKDLGIEIFDAGGKMKPLGSVIDILDTKLTGLSDERRQKILKDIFGLQGVSAAQVILKNGAKGLEEYSKGIGKAGAAQKLAEASSKGLAGTFKRLRAETISTAQAAYRELSPKIDEAAKRLATFVEQMRTGEGTGGKFVDFLKDLVAVGKGALKILDAIPGPVLKFGAQALIAGVALRKLTALTSSFGSSMAMPIARTKQFYAELTYAETRMQKVAMTSRAMGAALGQAAGVGGMLLLLQSTKQTDKGIQTFMTTAGGMAAGFAVGGPWGAAVGGAGGLLFGLMQKTKGANDAFSNTKPPIDYASSLNKISGAATTATREVIRLAIAADSRMQEAMAALGVSQRDVINSMLGMPGATRRVQDAINGATGELITYTDAWGVQHSVVTGNKTAADSLSSSLLKMGTDMREQADGVRDNARATEKLSKVYKGVPKDVLTEIRLMGTDLSKREIKLLTARYGLVPKQVATLLKANNLPATEAAIQSVINKARAYGKQRPEAKLGADTASANAGLSALERRLQRLVNRQWTTHVTTLFADSGSTKAERRASGGPVKAGMPYIVGDRGPRHTWELFVPDESGQILPRVPSPPTAAAPDLASGVALEQTFYRALSRALSESQAVITSKRDLEALDLMVGTS